MKILILLTMIFWTGCSIFSKKTVKKEVVSKPEVKKDKKEEKIYKMGIPLAETVDVFSPPLVQGKMAIQEELDVYEKAKKFLQEKQYDKASLEIKKIEKSPVRQIRVHAHFLSGEIMFESGEYDLAMQIYENILKNSAFSGLVIKSLQRLIICSEKLKLEEKRLRYHSLLHNTFES